MLVLEVITPRYWCRVLQRLRIVYRGNPRRNDTKAWYDLFQMYDLASVPPTLMSLLHGGEGECLVPPYTRGSVTLSPPRHYCYNAVANMLTQTPVVSGHGVRCWRR